MFTKLLLANSSCLAISVMPFSNYMRVLVSGLAHLALFIIRGLFATRGGTCVILRFSLLALLFSFNIQSTSSAKSRFLRLAVISPFCILRVFAPTDYGTGEI